MEINVTKSGASMDIDTHNAENTETSRLKPLQLSENPVGLEKLECERESDRTGRKNRKSLKKTGKCPAVLRPFPKPHLKSHEKMLESMRLESYTTNLGWEID